jgi:hypothetical protein
MKTFLLKLLSASCAATVLISASAHAATASGTIDQKALASLKRMSDALASAKSLTYQSRAIIEVPAKTGQLLTLFTDADVALMRPDKLRARLTGEAPPFHFYYDGKTVTAFAPGTKTFSTMKAPATIDAMLPDLENETGIRFATAPLLLSNPYRVLTRGLTSAVVVGPSMVRGTVCDHLAFRSPGINWEIWIAATGSPLPHRLAVTFTDRPNFPRTLVEFSSWNLHPWLSARDFGFSKPSGAAEIPFLSVLKSAGR